MTNSLNPELAIIQTFLEHSHPFSELETGLLIEVAASIEIYYLKKGETIHPDEGEKHLRLVRSGAVDIVSGGTAPGNTASGNGELLDRLGEYDCFNINGLAEDEPGVRANVIDDCLIYLIPGAVVQKIRAQDRSFDRYFHEQRARRLRRAARYTPRPSELLTPLEVLIAPRLVSLLPGASIQQAARVMTDERVSSLLIVQDGELLGIVTDRDLRSRVIAAGLTVDRAVSEVMTTAPVTVDVKATLFDAMMLMSEKGIHHLPVVDNQQPVSVLTTSDLVRARQRDPVYLLQAISRADDVGELTAISRELPALVQGLVAEGAKAHQVSHILCTISDRISRQLLQLAEAELGPPPVKYAWLAFGSQGRGEIALGGDQDNALVIEDSLKAEDEPYFDALAGFVCNGLNACGYPYCPGNIMATNHAWRLRLGDWKKTVSAWVRSPTDDAVMRVSIFFDIRPVSGDLHLGHELQQHMLKTASANSIFLAALARNALCNRPPLGFFRRFVVERNGEHQDMLDLKHRGIIPVVDMARVHAIAHQVYEVNTAGRLAALADKKVLALKDQRNLQDALEFVMQIRLQHQCQQLGNGEAADNFVNPDALASLARKQLRDAFSIIHDGQVTVSASFSAGTF